MKAREYMSGLGHGQNWLHVAPQESEYAHDNVSSYMADMERTSSIGVNYSHDRRRPKVKRHKAVNIIMDLSRVKMISPLLWIRVETLHEYRYALLDTGAAINIVSPKTLHLFHHRRLGTRMVRVKGVVGSGDWAEWYMLMLTFKDGQRIEVPCLKGALDSVGLLLGMPFIKQVRAVIDARSKIISTDVGDFAWGDREFEAEEMVHAQLLTADLTQEQIEELNLAFQGSILSDKAQDKLKQAFIDNKEIWTRSGYGHGQGVEHTFKLTSDKPIVLPPRHIPQKWQPVIEGEIDKMIRDGVVEHSVSPYCTYPVLIAKKDGSVRFAVDYRRLNAITLADKTPLPRIEDLIASVEGSKFFALLDLRGGFWHIPIASHQRHVTAFRTHNGLYQFRVMPFGLINAPATFQRWVSDIFHDKRYEGILVYLDDILIHVRTEEEFVDLIMEVLHRLKKYGACLKMSKCEIGRATFDYLGHTFKDGVRHPQAKKVEALSKIADPRDIRGVQSILGMFNYYRLYIPNFADKAVPLTTLLKKRNPFTWGPLQKEAVEEMAKTLSLAMLRVSPTGQEFRLETDASDMAVGAVLYNLAEYQQDGKERALPIMFLSKTLSDVERNWSAAEKEAYAIIWALEACDPFVRGRRVQVFCDHKNLQWMVSKKVGKIARWVSRLTEYDVEIVYRKGSENVVADFLSRYVEDDPFAKDSMYCYMVPVSEAPIRKRRRIEEEESEAVVVVLSSNDEKEEAPGSPTKEGADNFKDEVFEDLEIENITSKKGSAPNEELRQEEPTLQEVLDAQKDFEFPEVKQKGMRRNEGIWYYLNGIWVPPTLRTRILDGVHLRPPLWHPRAQRMKRIIARLYNWEGLQGDVEQYVRSCLVCQRTHPGLGIKDFAEFTHPVKRPFEAIYMDFWGPVNWNGSENIILTIIDNHTKWAEAIPLTGKSSKEVGEALFVHWISRFGPPKVIMNDNEAALISKVMKRWLHVLGIKDLQSTVYHPQGNAPVETFHRTLKTGLTNLRVLKDEILSLKEALAWVLFCYRALPHSSTYETPSFLTHGVDFKLRGDVSLLEGWRKKEPAKSRTTILNEMRNEVLRRYQYQQLKAIKNNKDRELERLEAGQLILCRLTPGQHEKLSRLIGTTKLLPWWSLPARIIEVNRSGNTATVKCTSSGFIFQTHIERCRRISKPETDKLKKEWDDVCTKERRLFEKLGSKWYEVENQKMRVHRGVGEPLRGVDEKPPKVPTP